MWDRLARTPAWALHLAGLLVFTLLWLGHRSFWLDDAFITFRYSRNLALGLGPVFNAGEAVEGYTNFLWMLAAAIPFALLEEAAALAAIKLAGLLIGLAILWRCFTFPAFDGSAEGSPRRRWLVLLLAVNPVFVGNCGDGLETPLFMLLLLESARALSHEPGPRNGTWMGVLTAAAVWSRPEALPLLLLWPAVVMICRRGDPRLTPWHWSFALSALPPVLGHLAWRFSSYGSLVPNTFYAKASGALLPRLSSGVLDLAKFSTIEVGIPPVALWIAVVVAGLGTVRLVRQGSPTARTLLAALWALVVFRVSFDLWSGGEFMGTYRFLAPALPPLFVLADEGRHWIARRTRLRLAWVCVAAGLIALGGNARLIESRSHYERGLREAHIALGRWLHETRAPDDLLAVGDAGAIPFFSRLPTLDLWGLSSPAISALPGEYGARPGTANYALGQSPDVIVLWNLEPIRPTPPIREGASALRMTLAQPFDREIGAHPEFRSGYRFVREFTFQPKVGPRQGYYLDVFERRTDARRRASP
jgi:hypothetical protein